MNLLNWGNWESFTETMGFLTILTWTGAGAGSLLVVISLAAGLYYLAELIEVLSRLCPKMGVISLPCTPS